MRRYYYAVQYTANNAYNLSPEFIREWGQAGILKFRSKKARDKWVADPIPYRDSCTYAFAKIASRNFDNIVDADNPSPEEAWSFGLKEKGN